MAHPALTINPFDVLLRVHQEGGTIDKAFSFWLRSFRDPPIRTVRSLFENCPRVDWLFWFLEQLVRYEYLEPAIVLTASYSVRRHLDAIADGRNYSRTRNFLHLPHAEGLTALRNVLRERMYNGGPNAK